MRQCSRIALTAGEPAGIGPDLCVQLAQIEQQSEVIVIADPDVLSQRAEQLGLPLKLEQADLSQVASSVPAGTTRFLPLICANSVLPGQLDSRNSSYVLATLQRAMDGCMQGQFDAMVTAPVHKGVINDAGITFTGHTEFLADGSKVEQVVMMLVSSSLRVALATTHLPLKEVSNAISKASLTAVIEILNSSLQHQFGIKQPEIAVCGLNPHAGENGHLGREELEIISPVIKKMAEAGIGVTGPWPADTVFVPNHLQAFDAVLAMYHDQGLPVLKHQGFGEAVNITLGLPFIRTSVDHGTALDLAGTGKADTGSLQAALSMAINMAQKQKTHE